MKKTISLLGIIFLLISCSSDDSGDNTNDQLQIKESFALRLALDNIKQSAQTSKAVNQQENLCFQFVYPITLSYNNGSTEVINNYEALLQVLLDETLADHITGIGYPFQVTISETNTIQTIQNEANFQSLVASCDYDDISVSSIVAATDDCFAANYPLTVMVNENPQTFASQSEAETFFINNSTNITTISFQYPLTFTLVSDGSTEVINNDFELINFINNFCGIN